MISISVSDHDQATSTTETVLEEWVKDFSAEVGNTLDAEITALAASVGGLGTFRVRVGGTTGAADGTVAASIGPNSPTEAQLIGNSNLAKPVGLTLVKLTGQAPASGTATVRGAVITFEGAP